MPCTNVVVVSIKVFLTQEFNSLSSFNFVHLLPFQEFTTTTTTTTTTVSSCYKTSRKGDNWCDDKNNNEGEYHKEIAKIVIFDNFF